MFPRKHVLPLTLAALLLGPDAIADELLSKLPASIPAAAPQARFNQFIVRYQDGTVARNRADVERQATRALAAAQAPAAKSAVSASPSARYLRALGRNAVVLRTSRGLSQADAQALMTQLAADPNVVYVEPDLMLHAFKPVQRADVDPPVVTDDPRSVSLQWDHAAPDGTLTTVGSDTNAYANYGGANVARAWNLADGNGITVAVLDTGITAHPDLDTSLGDAGYDFISDKFISGRSSDGRAAGGWDLGDWTTGDEYLYDNGGCVDASQQEPSSWHGTHVSGIIAEMANNGIGLAGVAYKAKVLPVRVLGHCGGSTSDITDAITWASGGSVAGIPVNTHPAQVINLSLGGGGACDANSALGQAISGAIARGTVVVVAAGNSNVDVANISPASCPGVIAVAATGITSTRAYYSDYGKGVAIAAPGGGVHPNDGAFGDTISAGVIWSTLNRGTTVPLADTGYAGYAGTSQATPHVAATVAMMLSARQEAQLSVPTPVQIRRLLSSTAAPLAVTPDKPIGAGLLDTYAAVRAALTTPDLSNPEVALTRGVPLNSQSGFVGETFLYTLSVPAGARNLTLRTYGGSGDVALYVKAGSAPAVDGTDATYRSTKAGNNESVTLTRPAAQTYYMRVVGAGNFADLTVLGTYTQ
ncbi:S8 family serine peptidase [Xanthomonas protegens]|uniref:S8 family serine peptidase n=1 Tax=Xanthomonas protegens TaxID=3380705 RepID=A0ABU9LEL8_9XANT